MSHPAFTLQKITAERADEMVAFYNRAIAFNNALPDREVRWDMFTHESMIKLIKQGVVYVISPKTTDTYPPVCMALFLDSRSDDDTWPPAEKLLPSKSLRLGRMATAPELAHKRFNVQYGWPLILEYARRHGFAALRCEAYPFPKLHEYYTSTLGMTFCGLRTYHDRHHKGEITANRYMLMLK